jgi:hypothetical protein
MINPAQGFVLCRVAAKDAALFEKEEREEVVY